MDVIAYSFNLPHLVCQEHDQCLVWLASNLMILVNFYV